MFELDVILGFIKSLKYQHRPYIRMVDRSHYKTPYIKIQDGQVHRRVTRLFLDGVIIEVRVMEYNQAYHPPPFELISTIDLTNPKALEQLASICLNQ